MSESVSVVFPSLAFEAHCWAKVVFRIQKILSSCQTNWQCFQRWTGVMETVDVQVRFPFVQLIFGLNSFKKGYPSMI